MAEIDQMHCSEEKEFKSRQCILTISLSSPLVEQCAPSLILTNLNPPSPKDALCQVWLKLTKWFWIKRFLAEIDPEVLEKKITILVHWFSGSGEEVYRQTDRQTDDEHQVMGSLAQMS